MKFDEGEQGVEGGAGVGKERTGRSSDRSAFSFENLSLSHFARAHTQWSCPSQMSNHLPPSILAVRFCVGMAPCNSVSHTKRPFLVTFKRA